MVVAGMVVLLPAPARPCSFCGWVSQPATYRQDAKQSRFILFGAVTDSRVLPANGVGEAGKGVSTFTIKTVLKTDPWLGTKTSLEIPRYIPVSDPKNPPKYVLFCDV